MNLLTITTKNPKSKKYNVSLDLGVLEKVAGAFGLFSKNFLKDIRESIRDMKAGKLIKADSLKDL